MPVILNEAARWRWLASDSVDELKSLLVPAADEFLVAYAVSRTVNSPAMDSEACLLPEAKQNRLF